ncbi:hypothetical protein HG537_0H01940 [Torulaspora globosa]|uniref:GPI transamidase component GAA1 n=1 Tax=Torulaspora globosa TaxID=48254 RepID=A0A7H9I0X5_9SACH|nr:hypothetical protein HG537_0H01940 [Torulaspora sp. CBS 2947]
MSLVSRLYRKVVDTGLLPKILAALRLLSVVCALVGVGWMVSVPLEGRYARTYVSENALMPSQAYSYFRETEWNLLRGYRTQIETLVDSNATIVAKNEAVASWLREFGVKTAIYRDEERGDTLYGVLHASRGDGTEAMLLTVPWKNADGFDNISGVSLGIALTRFFSRWPVWSKNIIVVFPENPEGALRSWVEAYHSSLDLTGGSIEAAIVLDYPGVNDYFDHVEVNYEGLNGELPNLDLVNIAVSIAEHEGMKVSLHGVPCDKIAENNFWSRLLVLALGIKNGALAGLRKVNGNEAFSGWRIQSVTLRAHGTTGVHDVTTFGRIPEAMFRSINNLLEKFHQSFFFYILLGPRYFVSISSYLPSAVILSVSFAIASLDTVINNQYKTLPLSSKYNLLALLIWAATLFVSFAIAQLSLKHDSPQTLLLTTFLIPLGPFIVKRAFTIADPLSYRLKTIAYLYFSLVLTSLLMVNFPLAFGMSIIAFPMIFVSKSTRTKNVFLLLLSNPFIAIWLICNWFEPDLQGPAVFSRLIYAWKHLNCWTWFVICLGWLPTWLLLALSTFDTHQDQRPKPPAKTA